MISPSSDEFDPERFRLPSSKVEPSNRIPPPRHRPGEPFLRGPIPFAWLAGACRLPGQALHVASAVWFRSRLQSRREIHLGLSDMERSLSVKRDSARRGLRLLEAAGLVRVGRGNGSKPIVEILDTTPKSLIMTTGRKPLYGPIPWNWWARAVRLPGKSLQVASACWLSAGWTRSAEFELGLSDWAELGLSRFAAARGLDALADSGLLNMTRRSGRKPMIRLLDGRERIDDVSIHP